MISKIVLVLSISMFITSCATTGSSSNQLTVTEIEGYQFVTSNLNNQPNSLFVLIKEKHGKWDIIVKNTDSGFIQKNHIKYGGEMFRIDLNTKEITYYYFKGKRTNPKLVSMEPGKKYECKSKYYKYKTACDAEFVKRTGFGVLGSILSMGGDSEKTLDIETAYTALKTAGAFNQLANYDNQCDKTREVINTYINNLKIKPNIMDKSGFYAGENLFKIEKSFTLNNGCDTDKTKININVEVNDTSYKITPAASRTDFLFKNKRKKFTPRFKLLGKYMTDGFRNPVKGKDKFLNAKLTKAKFTDNSRLNVEFEISNRSNTYVTIDTISFYADNKIKTKKLSQKISLPPHAVDNYKMNITDYPIYSKFNKDMTKKKAKSTKILLGFSILYNANNQSKTLFAKRNITYINAF